MLKRLALALVLLVGATQAHADTSLSNLSSGASVSGGNLFYVVQTPGTGGVKVTATQISTYLWGLVSGDCIASAGAFTCTKTNGSSFGTFATQSAPTGSTQCLHANSLGVVSGTGSDCGGAVSSVANSDGTLTISPTTGSVVASLALGHANTWTAVQTITNSDIALLGSSTGATTFRSANAGASNFTLTVPAATDQLVARATTDTLTNKTYDTAGTGNTFKINGTSITAISGNTGTVATSSGALTSGDCLKADASGNLVTTGAACGGSPGGSNTDVQFNSSSSFGGNASFTYNSTGQITLGSNGSNSGAIVLSGSTSGSSKITTDSSGDLTLPNLFLSQDSGLIYNGVAGSPMLDLSQGTITNDLTALSITGTWNNVATTFDAPLSMDITNTASHAGSALFDFQVGGTSQFAYYPNSSLLELGNSTNATAFHVYNTVDTLGGSTNYERGVFDWKVTSNVLTIGAQAGGTGALRKVNFIGSRIGVNISNPQSIMHVAGLQGATGSFSPIGDETVVLDNAGNSVLTIFNNGGGSGSIIRFTDSSFTEDGKIEYNMSSHGMYFGVNSVVHTSVLEAASQTWVSGLALGWSSSSSDATTAADTKLSRSAAGVVSVTNVLELGALTVAALPASPAPGMMAYVTDGTSSLAWGATVTGAGSTKYLVWYNGTNWTVAGK